jgi:Vitamin K-dependent gamma-carboxylase
MILKSIASSWDRFWFESTSTSAMCLFRIFFGLAAFLNGLFWIPDFLMWFGPQAVVSLDTVVQISQPHFTLWSFIPITDTSATYAVLGLYMLFALLTCIGLWTRFSTILLWCLLLSICHRDPFLWHGVDMVLCTTAPMLAFSHSGERFSIDAWRRKCKAGYYSYRLFPYWPQRLMQMQLAAIYMRAFSNKVYGETWRDGTAVYYATHCGWAKFGLPFFLENSFGYRLAAWSTLIIEFSLFTLIWNRKCRYYVMAAGITLHLLIEWSLNLDLLEWAIIFSYAVWIYPDDLDRFINGIKGHCMQSQKCSR